MIWLIGASGMLGSSIFNLLKMEEINFVVSGREVDITSEISVTNFIKSFNPKIIINCSAYTDVDGAESNFIESFKLNSFVPKVLGIVANRFDIKVLHLSTDYVFDGESSFPYKEDSPTNPINVYGKTKLQGECLLEASGAKHWIIRTSWLFGKGKKNFVSTMLDQMKYKENIFVVDDSFGSPTYTVDLAKVCLQLIQKEDFGKYHFSSSNFTNWYQFAIDIHEQAKKNNFNLLVKNIIPVKSDYFSRPAQRPKYSVLDNSKIVTTLKVKYKSYQESLEDYFLEDKNEKP